MEWRAQVLNSTQRTAANHGLLRTEEIAFPGEEHANILQYQMVNAESKHTSNIPQTRPSRIDLGMSICIYIYACNPIHVKEKDSMNLNASKKRDVGGREVKWEVG